MNVTEVKLSCGYRRYSTQVTWTQRLEKKYDRLGDPLRRRRGARSSRPQPGRAEEPSGFVSTPADSPRWLGPAMFPEQL